MSDLKVVRARPVREQVADLLRQAIMGGEFQPGERLVEGKLCELTGASRPSVREALRQLEVEGFVVSNGQRGTQVASISSEEAQHIYALRGVLEGLAARLFTENASPAQKKALAATVDAIGAAGASVEDLLKAKTAFYDVFLPGTGNPYVEEVLGSLQARVWLMRSKSLSTPGRPKESLEEIRTLVEAIEAGDSSAAEQAMIVHMINAARALKGAVE